MKELPSSSLVGLMTCVLRGVRPSSRESAPPNKLKSGFGRTVISRTRERTARIVLETQGETGDAPIALSAVAPIVPEAGAEMTQGGRVRRREAERDGHRRTGAASAAGNGHWRLRPGVHIRGLFASVVQRLWILTRPNTIQVPTSIDLERKLAPSRLRHRATFLCRTTL